MNSADEDSGDNLRIGPVSPDDQHAALRLVFRRLPPDDRRNRIEVALATAERDGVSRPGGLLAAHRGDRLVGAIHWQTQPGKTATVWPPQIVDGEPGPTAGSLLHAACDRLARQDVCMAQALLKTDASADAGVLRKGGFDRLAKLYYLVSPEIEFPRHPPSGPLEYESSTPLDFGRLAGIVEATYRETLDCPALGGIRRIEDVLAGYRHTGAFDPRLWLIVRHDGRDVGCLLLADHPEEGDYELIYMGLATSARGHGWGMDLVRQAQWRTRRAGRPRLVLAVDAANHPARKTYTAAGFRVWDRRSAYVKVLRPSGS